MTSLWAERTPRPDGIAKTSRRRIRRRGWSSAAAWRACCAPTCWAGPGARARWRNRGASGRASRRTPREGDRAAQPRVRPADEEHGVENARLYYEANQAAVAGLRQLSDAFPCDFEEKTAYVYAEDSTEGLERELAAYEQLGIPHHVLPSAPVPIANKGALGDGAPGAVQPLKLLYRAGAVGRRVRERLRLGGVGNTARTQGAPSLPSTSCSRPITPWSTSRDSIS